MGNTLSDALYSDNPNRRARAGQLKDDIEDFCRQFNTMKASRDKSLEEIGSRLSRFLKSQGYNSPEELDAKVRETLKDDALREYIEICNRHKKNSAIESSIFQVCSVVSVVSGVFLGGLVAFGVIAAATAITCLEIIAGIAAVIGVVLVILAAIQGAQERADLQDAIRKLAFKRVEACQALKEMNAITNWLESIRDWLDNPRIMNNPERLRTKLEGDFKKDFAEAERGPVIKYLTKMDRDRGAWTDEDPDWRSEPSQTRQLRVASAQPNDASGLFLAYVVGGERKTFTIALEKQPLSAQLPNEVPNISLLATDVQKLLNDVLPRPIARVCCFSQGLSHTVQIEGPEFLTDDPKVQDIAQNLGIHSLRISDVW
ncbi:hypothetical protein B0H14DRAFT_2675406 [Mycena olivaceomarginata]|nr:hypothetical protein B0H14DRAFT_2675406 [Mycena olivaceomarginata]